MTALSRRSLLAAPLLAGVPAAAQASFPGARPVTLVMPYTAGGLPTVLGNIITQGLAQRLGGSFVTDFRPGAATAIAARQVARAQPDGHTLLFGSVTTFAAVPHAQRNPGYDPLADFHHLTMIGNTLFMLVGHPRWPNLAAVLEEARRRPGQLSYASFGIGSTAHLVMVDFLRRAGVEMLHIPFGGSGPAITEILAGRVDLMFPTFASAKPHVEPGRLQGFGLPARNRIPSMPAVPTLSELGFTDFHFDAWLGVSAPAGTPPAVAEELEAALVATFAEATTRARLEELGLEPAPPGRAAMFASIRRNLDANRELMARAGIMRE